MLCNAHLDPIWQWTWDEGISAAIATFKSAADLAEEFDYVFCHGESLLYETIEKNAPKLFERIKKLIAEGKWHVSGGWYLQPDCLLPCGETFARQISVGKAYFKEKFGVEPCVATNYDSFGHSLGLVQIMAKNGYKGYLFCRPRNNPYLEYPAKFFRWEAPDGSNIIASQSASYCSALGAAAEKITAETRNTAVGMLGAEGNEEKQVGEDVDYVLWGVGNHGGGPSRKDLRNIAALQMDGVQFLHSSPEALFADKIRVGGTVRQSLVTVNPGCYSSMARVKQAYRRTENLFFATEKMLAAARLRGMALEYEPLKEAEKRLLLATFHDILPGTCVEEGEREGLGLLASCEKIMKDYRTQAFLYMTVGTEKAREGEYLVFVFNYLPREVVLPIEAEFSVAERHFDAVTSVSHVYDETGAEVSSQTVKEASTLHLDWRKRVVFEGRLKPLSVTRFTLKTTLEAIEEKPAPVCSLSELLQGNALLSEPITLELYADSADPWAMSEAENRALGTSPKAFALMDACAAQRFCAVEKPLPPVRVIEDGAVYTKAEGLYELDSTRAVLQYTLYKKQPYIDLRVEVEFAEKNRLLRLKIALPKAFQDAETVGDGPYIWEKKPDGGELTFQKWFGKRRQDGKIFAVFNNGVYAGKAEDGYLYLTLLRGVGYCFHPIGTKTLYPQERYLPRIDCGRYIYDFRLFVGDVYAVNEAAEAFNALPYAVNLFPTGGGTGAERGVRVDGNVSLTALISKEDDSYILRLYNPNEKEEKFSVRVGEDSVSAACGAREVVTVIERNGTFRVLHEEMPS